MTQDMRDIPEPGPLTFTGGQPGAALTAKAATTRRPSVLALGGLASIVAVAWIWSRVAQDAVDARTRERLLPRPRAAAVPSAADIRVR